ncbi:hypothetical protein V6N11_012612 [Hibiscus sabdariffa]|uniref:Uncharacterized protein n=1 Tax=Hibiscus sabdariffa TaxID=183260 RepID=A0ABR2QBN5_9ROSI
MTSTQLLSKLEEAQVKALSKEMSYLSTEAIIKSSCCYKSSIDVSENDLLVEELGEGHNAEDDDAKAFLFVEILLKRRLKLLPQSAYIRVALYFIVDIFLDMRSLIVVSFKSTTPLAEPSRIRNGE